MTPFCRPRCGNEPKLTWRALEESNTCNLCSLQSIGEPAPISVGLCNWASKGIENALTKEKSSAVLHFLPGGRGGSRPISTEPCPRLAWCATRRKRPLTGPSSARSRGWRGRLTRAWRDTSTALCPCAARPADYHHVRMKVRAPLAQSLPLRCLPLRFQHGLRVLMTSYTVPLPSLTFKASVYHRVSSSCLQSYCVR